MEIPGPTPQGGPYKLFPVSGSWAAAPSCTRGFPGRVSAPVSALTKAGTTGPGDPGTMRLSLDLLPNPDAGAWQVERVAARKPLLPATHAQTHVEGETV